MSKEDQWTNGKAVMVQLGGRRPSYRCEDCGANVFTESTLNSKKLRCNGCGAVYTAEPSTPS